MEKNEKTEIVLDYSGEQDVVVDYSKARGIERLTQDAIAMAIEDAYIDPERINLKPRSVVHILKHFEVISIWELEMILKFINDAFGFGEKELNDKSVRNMMINRLLNVK